MSFEACGGEFRYNPERRHLLAPRYLMKRANKRHFAMQRSGEPFRRRSPRNVAQTSMPRRVIVCNYPVRVTPPEGPMVIDIARRKFVGALGGAAAWPIAARAQQGVKRIGVLMPESEAVAGSKARITAFETRLRALGWTLGRNLQIDSRWARGDMDRTRVLAAELVDAAPDALVAVATPSLVAIQKATHTIPIVFVGVSEPVANGFVASLAHPGGNATGFSNLEPGFGAKWLDLLKQIAPRVSRVSVMFNSTTGVTTDAFFRAVDSAAPGFAVVAVRSDVHSLEETEAVMQSLFGDGSGGLIFPPDPFTRQNSKRIVELANTYRLPAIYPFRDFADAGGLASYGIDITELILLAADYVDRILKGEKPGDLPVQQPTKFQLIVNLKTAKALGLTVPLTLQASADELIE
jgi:putative tryptophan/tyrosine transport system substrate-binding protein